MNVSKISFALHRLAASKCFYLCKLGVTHVLNAAEGRKEKNGTVDTSKVFNNEQRYVYKLLYNPCFARNTTSPGASPIKVSSLWTCRRLISRSTSTRWWTSSTRPWRPGARFSSIARWGCPGAPPVSSPTSCSDTRCQRGRPLPR